MRLIGLRNFAFGVQDMKKLIGTIESGENGTMDIDPRPSGFRRKKIAETGQFFFDFGRFVSGPRSSPFRRGGDGTEGKSEWREICSFEIRKSRDDALIGTGFAISKVANFMTLAPGVASSEHGLAWGMLMGSVVKFNAKSKRLGGTSDRKGPENDIWMTKIRGDPG